MNEITYRFLGKDRPIGPSMHDEGVIFLKFKSKVEYSNLDMNAHGEGAIGDRKT